MAGGQTSDAADARDQAAEAGVPRQVAAARRISLGWIRATSPINAEPVTFVPGETLPEWAAELLAGGFGHLDPVDGAMVLVAP